MQPGVGLDDEFRGLDVIRVGGKYRLREQIGSGSFGIVYHGVNIVSKEDVAIKLESIDTEFPQLQHEYRVYKNIAGGIGIPSIRWFGTEGDYNTLVLERLGPSLEDIFNRFDRKFSLKTVLLLADQMISRIEYVHSCHFIHGDIKPANFLMGANDYDHQVYIIDFGLAKRYRDPNTHLHIPYKENCPPVGTTPYISINNHLGVEQSRRDDLESLAYVLLYFLCGSLPWHGVKFTGNKQQRNTTLRQKRSRRLALMCSACPPEFGTFLDYVHTLAFDEKLDYDYIHQLFHELLIREGHQYGHPFPDSTIDISQHDRRAAARVKVNR
ncbi:hypothetical protein PILCRDRAFT_68184 [Piloderma croceum F 1598]|uniref:non-specific serine/threonine protein kinase n=1 Tax=Piloderma croceum (strain F 1598) TaxID=765440 RepID=A0A0C3BCN7_PILCF|nr:hypothetical protein PILCRDRAFT_68184 [Piloderma croceum F 1598]